MYYYLECLCIEKDAEVNKGFTQYFERICSQDIAENAKKGVDDNGIDTAALIAFLYRLNTNGLKYNFIINICRSDSKYNGSIEVENSQTPSLSQIG